MPALQAQWRSPRARYAEVWLVPSAPGWQCQQGWRGALRARPLGSPRRHRTDAVPRHRGRDLGGLHRLLGRSRHLPSFGFRQVGEGPRGRPSCSQTWGVPGPLASRPPCLPDRKKVLDFYQRACLSGYCSAFAYKPMSCSLSSQLNGKCIELVQAPGQSSIFTLCELPSTIPIKLSTRHNSWSSDGTVRRRGMGGGASRGPWNPS